MQYSTTCVPMTERQALTMSLLEFVTPYLRSVASSDDLDFEDLYQDASIKILQILDQYRDRVRHLQAYVLISIRHLCISKVRYARRRRAISLDEPLLADVSFGLADLLPDPYRVDPSTVVLAQERLVELQSKVAAAKHYGTRRMLGEMHETALAGVSVDDHLQAIQL